MRLFEGDLAASLYLADLQDWSRRAIDVLAEETKQPTPAAQQMSYARAPGGGGAEHLLPTGRFFRSHSRSRLHNEKNPSIPRDRPARWISSCQAFHESLTNPKHWQDLPCHHQAEGQFQNHSCTTIMLPWGGRSSRQFFNTGWLCHAGGHAFSQ